VFAAIDNAQPIYQNILVVLLPQLGVYDLDTY
jgi:hypothetical protein